VTVARRQILGFAPPSHPYDLGAETVIPTFVSFVVKSKKATPMRLNHPSFAWRRAAEP
jgi:hypothetical protein